MSSYRFKVGDVIIYPNIIKSFSVGTITGIHEIYEIKYYVMTVEGVKNVVYESISAMDDYAEIYDSAAGIWMRL